jgi:alpha-L-fucosidase
MWNRFAAGENIWMRRSRKISPTVRGTDTGFAAANLLDSTGTRYWSTDDAVTTPTAVIELPKPVTFNVIQLREFLPLGQRIDRFAVDAWVNHSWQPIAEGTSIGNRRLLKTASTTTTKVRLRITEASACPAFYGFGLFAEPSQRY